MLISPKRFPEYRRGTVLSRTNSECPGKKDMTRCASAPPYEVSNRTTPILSGPGGKELAWRW